MNQPKVAIIILNWNSWIDTIECLESIYQIAYSNYNIIVVDNRSENESIEKIKKYCEGKLSVESKFFKYNFENKPIRIIEYNREEIENEEREYKYVFDLLPNKNLIIIKNENNYGFAEGNNIGIRYALKSLNPKYIMLLNNDTVVDKNFLGEMINIAEHDEKIAAVQSKLLRKDNIQIIDSLGQEVFSDGRIREISSKKNSDCVFIPNEIFGVCAAAALFKVAIFKKIGLFDQVFFALFEDVDLSWRIRLEGYKSFLASESIVYHKRGISGKDLSQKNRTLNYYSVRNSLLILIRYYPTINLLKFFPTTFGLFILSFFYSLKTNTTNNLLALIFQNLKKRKRIQANPVIRDIQDNWIIKTKLVNYYKKLFLKVM